MNVAEKKTSQPIRVYVRLRPALPQEQKPESCSIIQQICPREIVLKSGLNERRYSYDHVFDEKASQEDVFNGVAAPLITSAVSGYNCTIFAYGQTGTGKTYTIMGQNPNGSTEDSDPSFGLIPRTCTRLFVELSKLPPKTEYTVRISLLEVYNEEVRDLLGESHSIRIYDDPGVKGSIFFKGMTEVTVCNAHQVLEWLQLALSKRQTAATNFNAQSSRSHMIFSFLINKREITIDGEVMKTGKFHLIDLAGSENMGKLSGSDARAKEASSINKSIITLGKVLKALGQKIQFIPYRDSKLTRILQDSLGGNSKTSMIATISPMADAWEETITTLEYAQTTRSVMNWPQINLSRNQADFVKDLESEIKILQKELSVMRSGYGFYLSEETYSKLSEEKEVHQRKILELNRQMNDLEDFKIQQEIEITNLEESFEQTKIYLKKLEKEVEEKKRELRVNEFIAASMSKNNQELKVKTEDLLDICNNITKQEDLFYTKHVNQCDATLNNFSIAQDLSTMSIDTFNKMQVLSQTYADSQEKVIGEIRQQNQSLNETSVKIQVLTNLLASEVENESKHNRLTLEGLLQSESGTYSIEEIDQFFASFADTLETLETCEKVHAAIMSFEESSSTNRDLTVASYEKFFKLLDKKHHELTDILEWWTVSDQFKSELDRRRERLLHQRSERNLARAAIEKYISNLENNTEAVELDIYSLKNVIEEITRFEEKLKDAEELNLMSALRSSEREFIETLEQTVKTQASKTNDISTSIDERVQNLQVATAENKAKCDEFVKGLFTCVRDNIERHNQEVKNVLTEWAEKAKEIRENVCNPILDYGKGIDKNLELLSIINESYTTKMTNLIEQSSSYMQQLQQNVVSMAHVGDTPVKKSFSVPEKILLPSRKSLAGKFSEIEEGCANSD